MKQESRHFKAFWTFQGTEEHVPGESPVDILEADVYSKLLGGLERDGDFFGLVDSNGVTLQVMYEGGADRYWVDIPQPTQRGSLGRYFTFDEAVDLFKSLPECFSALSVPGFEFKSWQ